MKRKIAIFAVLLVILVLVGFSPFEKVSANPYSHPGTRPQIIIITPPDPHKRYENTSVSLQVEVDMLDEFPRIRNMYYALDGGPATYFDFAKVRNISYWPDKNGYVLAAKVDMENLSEGNHTVTAYCRDSNGNVTSTSRSFIVDSQYQITVIQILAPKNMTYSTKEIPLIFTVNGALKNASYGFWPPSPNKNEVGNPVAGNTTLTELSDGRYRILVYAFADGRGGGGSFVEFTVNSSQANFSLTLKSPSIYITLAVVITIVAVASISLVYFKKHGDRNK